MAHMDTRFFAGSSFARTLSRKLMSRWIWATWLALALATPTTVAHAEPFELPPVNETLAPDDARAAIFHRVSLLGNTVIPSAELDAISAPYLGRPISDSEIEALRQELTQHYIKQGFINSGVLLHPEGTRDGSLGFRVIEGRIGNIHIRGLEHLAPEYLAQRFTDRNEVFNLGILQQRMQLLLTDPVVGRLSARVVPGGVRGLADLQVDVTEARRYQLTAFTSNHQPPSTGRILAGIQGELRNLTGWGDALNLTLQSSNGQEGYSVAWQMPVTARGTALNLGSYQSNASVIEEPLNRLDVRSRSEGWELGLSHALIQSITRRLALGVAYTNRASSTTLGGVPFAFSAGAADGRNTVSEWRFYQEYMLRRERESYAFRSTFVGGENNADTASAIPGQPHRHYLTWVGQAQAAFPAFERGQLLVRGSAQWSDGALVPMGQFALGGAATVRGYRENQLVRDRGWTSSVEYRHMFMANAETNFQLTLFPFVDYGEGWNTSQRSDTLSSVGVGIALNYGRMEAELALAHRIAKPAVMTSGALQDDGVHFQIRYRFF